MTQEDKIEFKLMFIEVLKDGNFVTKEDLKNLATKDDIARLEERMDRLEERMDRLEDRMDKLEDRMDRLEDRMDKLEDRMDKLEDRMDRLEDRMDKLEDRMDKLEDHMDKLEDHMDKLEDRIDRLEGYVHEEFLLIENEMMPKINAMYEALTTRVSHVECNDRMEVIEGKTDAITPLLITVKKNTTKLREHEERIKSLEAPA